MEAEAQHGADLRDNDEGSYEEIRKASRMAAKCTPLPTLFYIAASENLAFILFSPILTC